jgi:hypothetical protein
VHDRRQCRRGNTSRYGVRRSHADGLRHRRPFGSKGGNRGQRAFAKRERRKSIPRRTNYSRIIRPAFVSIARSHLFTGEERWHARPCLFVTIVVRKSKKERAPACGSPIRMHAEVPRLRIFATAARARCQGAPPPDGAVARRPPPSLEPAVIGASRPIRLGGRARRADA